MYYSRPSSQDLRLSASNYNRVTTPESSGGRRGNFQRSSSADQGTTQEKDITGMLNNFSKALGKSPQFLYYFPYTDRSYILFRKRNMDFSIKLATKQLIFFKSGPFKSWESPLNPALLFWCWPICFCFLLTIQSTACTKVTKTTVMCSNFCIRNHHYYDRCNEYYTNMMQCSL